MQHTHRRGLSLRKPRNTETRCFSQNACHSRRPSSPEPQDQPLKTARKLEADTTQRFQAFFRGDWQTLLPVERRTFDRQLPERRHRVNASKRVFGAPAPWCCLEWRRQRVRPQVLRRRCCTPRRFRCHKDLSISVHNKTREFPHTTRGPTARTSRAVAWLMTWQDGQLNTCARLWGHGDLRPELTSLLISLIQCKLYEERGGASE